MKKQTKNGQVKHGKRPAPGKKALTIEALEARVAPAVAHDKKQPVPPPYAPGTLYGLVRRHNLHS